MINQLQNIREQLFDAPSSTKKSFNTIVEYFSKIEEIDLAVLLDSEEANIMPPLSQVGFIKKSIKLAEKYLSKSQKELLRKYESSLSLIEKPGKDIKSYKAAKNKRFNFLTDKVFSDPEYKNLKESLNYEHRK